MLIWHRDKLKLTIITDQFLQAVFDHILGRDVVKKLMQVSELLLFILSQKRFAIHFINLVVELARRLPKVTNGEAFNNS